MGLREHHKLLDFGCGSLRVGRLLIPYLAAGNYHGLEPNRWLIDEAISRQIGETLISLKQPKFFQFDDCAAERCGSDFDFIIAQSVLSHTGMDLLKRSLEGFRLALAPSGLALVTVLLPEQLGGVEFHGEGWVYPECVSYSPEVLKKLIGEAELFGRSIPWHHPRQTWYVLSRSKDAIPPSSFDVHLKGETFENFSLKPNHEQAQKAETFGQKLRQFLGI